VAREQTKEKLISSALPSPVLVVQLSAVVLAFVILNASIESSEQAKGGDCPDPIRSNDIGNYM
jgi:hypothetical protein